YRGTAAFSEPETQPWRDFFYAHPNIVGHMDYHSYSQLLLWP
ncbi:MAG: zinc carboxypeptidase, partial [Planctomycetota bacterium]